MISVSFTPKFKSKTIYDEMIGKNWFEFQNKAFELGQEMLSYIQQFIASKIKGESTGNLIQSIKLYSHAGAGEAQVSWGIGLISEMNILAPYWHIIDVGGSGWKGDYHFVPGFFDGGKFKYNPMIADGKSLPSGVKGIIKPMGYISASRFKLDAEINKILTTLKGK